MFATTTISNIRNRGGLFCRFVADPYALDRLDEVSNPARRAALEIAIRTKALPLLIGDYFDRKDFTPYREAGLKVLGRGFHAIATTEPGSQTVRKYHYRHIGEDEETLQKHIDVISNKQEILLHYLGGMAVRQSYSIESAPFNNSIPMIVATQPYIQVDRAINLPSMIRRGPEKLPEVPDLPIFITNNQEMMWEAAAASDIIGRNNLGIVDGRLRLVDPIPLLHDDSASVNQYNHAGQIIDQIDQFLDASRFPENGR